MKNIPAQTIYELLSGTDGTFGLFIQDLESGKTFAVNETQVFPSASVIKIPLLGFLLKKVEEGTIDWNAAVEIAARNRVGGTGILAELDTAYCPSVRSLAVLMITLSDNTATNQLIDLVGHEALNQFCLDMGYRHTVLGRKMLDFEALKEGKNNYMTAGEAGDMLAKIATGCFVSPWVSAQMLDIMSKQQFRHKLPGLIPAVPCWASPEEKRELRPDTVMVANKTGDLTGVQHDVGIFTLPDGRRYVIAAFSAELASDGEGVLTIARISQAVYQALQ
ncbi:MAG: serine hydrolase [Pygmaiobacter sp.]